LALPQETKQASKHRKQAKNKTKNVAVIFEFTLHLTLLSPNHPRAEQLLQQILSPTQEMLSHVYAKEIWLQWKVVGLRINAPLFGKGGGGWGWFRESVIGH